MNRLWTLLFYDHKCYWRRPVWRFSKCLTYCILLLYLFRFFLLFLAFVVVLQKRNVAGNFYHKISCVDGGSSWNYCLNQTSRLPQKVFKKCLVWKKLDYGGAWFCLVSPFDGEQHKSNSSMLCYELTLGNDQLSCRILFSCHIYYIKISFS